MPRKKPEELADVAEETFAEETTPVETEAPAVAAPVIKPVTVDSSVALNADLNGDGHISAEEYAMAMEFKRKRLEDEDAMRDAQRKMAWFALLGMLLYPFAVVLAVFLSLDQAGEILGDMAATYFVSVAAIVAAFFGGQAYMRSRGD
jgi:hypothetical protein